MATGEIPLFGKSSTTGTNTVHAYPLGIFNIAIENSPFIVDLPIQNGDFI